MEKGLYEDLSHANSISLRELLQQYRDDVSSTKKGFKEEKYKINKLCKNTIASFKLAKITPLKVRKFQDSCLLTYNPSTTNKYLTLISVAIKHARQMLEIYLPNNPCDFVKRLKEPEFQNEIIDEREEELLHAILSRLKFRGGWFIAEGMEIVFSFLTNLKKLITACI